GGGRGGGGGGGGRSGGRRGIGVRGGGGRLRAPAASVRRAQRAAGGRRSERLLGVAFGLLARDQLVAFGGDLAHAAQHSAGAGRDQATDDDVLLEPLEGVCLAVDGSIGQDAGSLLE